MKRLRKALSLLLVGVIAVTSLLCGTVTASAGLVYWACYDETDSTPTVQIKGILPNEMNYIHEKSSNGAVYVVAKFGDGDDSVTLGYTFYRGFVQLTNTDMVKSGVFLDLGYEYNFVFELKDQTSNNKKYYDIIKKAKTCKITLGVTDESGAVKNYYGYSELSEVDFLNMSETSTVTTDNSTSTKSTIKIYREISGNKVKLYIDGLNEAYFKNFNKKHSVKSRKTANYYISIDFSDSSYTSFWVDSNDYSKIKTVESTISDYSFNCESIDYYIFNKEKLTSGFCLTVTDKTIISKLKQAKRIDSIFIKIDDWDELLSFGDNDFTIKTVVAPRKTIADLKIDTISSKAYTGKARKPSVTIKDGSKTLKYGTDYTLTYSNNTNIGTATVTIKGKGDYTGTKKVSFKIVPPKTTLSVNKVNGKYTLSWKAISGIDKYQIKYSDDNGKTYKSAGTVASSKTKVTYTLKTDKSYIFRIRSYKKVNGKIYYSEWTEYDPNPKIVKPYEEQQPFDVYIKYSGNSAYIYLDGINDSSISMYNQKNGYNTKDISGYTFGLAYYDDNTQNRILLDFSVYTNSDITSIKYSGGDLLTGFSDTKTGNFTDLSNKIEAEYYTNLAGLTSGYCIKITDKTVVSYLKKIKPLHVSINAWDKSNKIMKGKYTLWIEPIVNKLS